MGKKLKYLEMIQDIISRMAHNSFNLKGWSVTLIAGIMVLANRETSKWYYFIAYIPIIAFWFIDSYYLLQERLFRTLYNKARKLDENDVDFDMDINDPEIKERTDGYWTVFFSKTESAFYISLLVAVSVVVALSAI